MSGKFSSGTKTPKQKQAIHHKIIEYTLQDIEHTLQDIEHTSKDYKIYTTGYWTYITK